jgi:hypothetical protein
VKLGYNEHGYNEQFLSKIGHINTQINPVITNPGYNELKCPELFVITEFDCIL